MHVACLDLEGVLIPEIWVALAERTGIDALRLTTRDIPVYTELMEHRLAVLNANGLGMPDLQAAIAGLAPLDGAPDFLDWLRGRSQVAIVSDTFYELAMPLVAQLGFPLLLCHRLEIEGGRIRAYRLRQEDPKRHAVRAFQGLNYRVVAAGDSYNDASMLEEADAGIFYRPPPRVVADFPQFPVTRSYEELREAFERALQTPV